MGPVGVDSINLKLNGIMKYQESTKYLVKKYFESNKGGALDSS
jgi:hypothetical protein